MNISLIANNISKTYNNQQIFKNINFKLFNNDNIVVTGKNGSGKSTLLKILAKLVSPTNGSVTYTIDNFKQATTGICYQIGFASSEIFFYDELTIIENINFALQNSNQNIAKAKNLLDYFNLSDQSNKQVKYLSSGMYQKLRLVLAFSKSLPILILDEPSTYLDSKSKNKLYKLLEIEKQNKILITATNDAKEISIYKENICLD